MSATSPRGRRRAPGDDTFAIDHLAGDLKGRSVRGGAVTMAGQAAKFVLQMGSTVVLARLLTPRDFGLVAMVTAVTGFVVLFKDLGLSMATVQRERITHRQVSTLFAINVVVSAVLAVVVAALAPLIARFYGEPELALIAVVLSCTFVFSGLTAQHTALIRRQMRFGTVAGIEITALAAGVAAALVLAWAGAGHWAVVGMAVTGSLLGMILTWWRSPWRPGRPGSVREVLPLVRFGANYTGFNVINYFSRNMDNVLIGWQFGAGTLGLYTKAYALLLLPLRQINTPLTGVALPVLSRLQSRPEEYRRYYCRALNLIAYVAVPLIALLGALSEPVILLVLGDQWAEAAPIFAILAVAAVGQPILFTIGWVNTSLGRTDKQLRWSLMSDPVFVLSFFVGLPWGPHGVAAAYAVAVNAMIVPGLRYAYRGSPLTLADAWSAVRRPLVLTAAMVAAALAVRLSLPGASPLAVTLLGLAAAAFVAAASLALVRGVRTEVRQILALARHLKPADRQS